MMSVRKANVRDASAIAHVHVQSWQTTYAGIVPDEYLASLNEVERVPVWREWLSRDIQVFVVEMEGEVVGFGSAGPIREPLQDYDAELFAIYVLKHAQKRGIGTALLGSLAASLRAKGLNGMVAWVLEGNPSVRFYEKSGALRISSKEIEIGGVMLPELAFGWPHLETISSPKTTLVNLNHNS
jgi:L-amino acid N-acyltransferase YncA